MFNSKYSNFLTMLLIVIIVAILGIIGYFAYDMFNQHDKNSKAQSAIEEFNKATQSVKKEFASNTANETANEKVGEVQNPLETLNTTASQANTATSGATANVQKTYLDGYEILGTINIPKTKCNYPILNEVTKHSIEVAVAVLYPTKLESLNMPGNTVIVGHNYRNGLFFSNNKKLSEGDKIIIESATEKVTYVIYSMYETSPDDAEYMQRDTEGKREISLSTCTDDSSKRLIILAREEGK